MKVRCALWLDTNVRRLSLFGEYVYFRSFSNARGGWTCAFEELGISCHEILRHHWEQVDPFEADWRQAAPVDIPFTFSEGLLTVGRSAVQLTAVPNRDDDCDACFFSGTGICRHIPCDGCTWRPA